MGNITEDLEVNSNSKNPTLYSSNENTTTAPTNSDHLSEEKQEKKDKSSFNLKKILPLDFLGKLGAVGGMIGLLITINTWFNERPNLKLEIERVDLVQFIQESDINTLEKDVINQLIAQEYEYLDITEDYVNNLIEEIYNLLEASNGMFIKYPEDESISSDPLQDFKDNLTTTIEHFKEKESDEENSGQKRRYGELISRLEYVKDFIYKIKTHSRVSLAVKVENRSRLSNYVNAQGVLMFHKNERISTSVPQMIVSLLDNEVTSNLGKIEGHGVSSLIFEAEVNELNKDNETYVDVAFKNRANNVDDYNVILVLQDINDREWHEQVIFSEFTSRRIKQELKASAGEVFERIQR